MVDTKREIERMIEMLDATRRPTSPGVEGRLRELRERDEGERHVPVEDDAARLSEAIMGLGSRLVVMMHGTSNDGSCRGALCAVGDDRRALVCYVDVEGL